MHSERGRNHRQFSLRTLLIVLTIVAVVAALWRIFPIGTSAALIILTIWITALVAAALGNQERFDVLRRIADRQKSIILMRFRRASNVANPVGDVLPVGEPGLSHHTPASSNARSLGLVSTMRFE